ncbi:FAD-dependent monooxygenase [Bacillus gobiensis]|uniref:FAD-dependent monooxygenase n=1 Tax=Bacillus gobiensis TaxID=1441095 RepID=UPI003D218E47
MNSFDTDVLIVGAGPTGLTLANELARHDISFKIIDSAITTSQTTKALGIMPRTLELYEKTGIAEEMVEKGLDTPAFNVMNKDHKLIYFDFNKQCNSPFPFVLMLPQNKTEEILYNYLMKQNYDVEWETKLLEIEQDANGTTVIVQKGIEKTANIRTKYIVGCDGAHSTVRHQLGLNFEGVTIQQNFSLVDLKVEWELPYNESYAFVDRGKFIAFFPMKDGKHRILMTSDIGAKEHSEVSIEEIEQMIHAVGPTNTSVSNVLWTSRFLVNQRMVKQARLGRVFLAGDAAHIHSPVGAQGMNTGIQDAYNLSWKLALVLKNYSPDTLLDTYTTEREPVWGNLLLGTERFTRILLQKSRLVNQVRKTIAPVITSSRFINQKFIDALSQTGIHYRHSPIVNGEEYGSKVFNKGDWLQPGDRVPDEIIGNGQRLHHLLTTTKHVLFVFTQDYETFKKIKENVESYPIQVFQIGIERNCAIQQNYLCDSKGQIYSKYGFASKEGMLVIRPDGYIGFKCVELNINLLKKHLQIIFN